jgi:hypothetical protein
MNPLPHSMIKHIFSFILQPYEINLLSNTNLELEDVKILEDKKKNHIYLLKEFKAKTCFWRVKWLNKSFDLGSSGDEEEEPEIKKYESSRAGLEFITTYWNYHYPAYFDETALVTNTNNWEEEYITDVNKCARIFKNLTMLNNYIWSDKHKGLFKPGLKHRLVIALYDKPVIL